MSWNKAKWLTADVAKSLNLSGDNIRDLARCGRLKFETTPGGVRLFDPVETARFALDRKIRKEKRGRA